MSDVAIREDVVFGTGGGRDLRCDVYSAPGVSEPAPGLLLLHPGGWREGSKAAMRETALRLAASGFVCVASEYRLTPESPWPAQIEDVKAAIRWMHAQCSELGIDETKIGALGRSAGGHLALLAAGTPGLAAFSGNGGNAEASERLSAIVAIFPPAFFSVSGDLPRGATPARGLMGDGAQEDVARAASPLTHVVAGFPPTFLIHGTADELVPHAASEVLYEALRQAGVPSELHLYADQPHAFAGKPEFIDLTCAESAHFLHRYLGAMRSSKGQEAAVPA